MRALLLTILFGVEAVLAARGANSRHSDWLSDFFLQALVKSVILLAGLFVGFTWLRHRREVAEAAPIAVRPVGLTWLAVHAASYALLLGLTFGIRSSSLTNLAWDLVNCARIVIALASVVSGTLAFVSTAFLREVIRITGRLYWYAAALASLTFPALAIRTAQWESAGIPLSRVTLKLSQWMLGPFLPGLFAGFQDLTLGTDRFSVIVGPGCSGLEGLGLLLAFSALWLFLFHNELRLLRALLLVPVSVVLLFLLNAVRIAALVLIGNAGYPDIAIHGFHSQAGWITFIGVAFGMVVFANRFEWISRTAARRPDAAGLSPTGDFLIPFLSLIAAGMVAQAFSGSFEWAYSLRLPAALAALLLCRSGYRAIDWRFGWQALVAGAAVFALWIFMDRSTSPMPPALASASEGVRIFWIVTRVLGATIAVPLAEELAFRGYLMRRLTAENFECISFVSVSLWAVLGSSVIFGITHGTRWIEGVAAGLIYGYISRRSGRLGDAVAAHALTNGLLACYVVAAGHWQYW